MRLKLMLIKKQNASQNRTRVSNVLMHKSNNMQQLLENILDALCKATSRDIFVMLPSKEKERVPYLIKEIKNTLDRVKA